MFNTPTAHGLFFTLIIQFLKLAAGLGRLYLRLSGFQETVESKVVRTSLL